MGMKLTCLVLCLGFLQLGVLGQESGGSDSGQSSGSSGGRSGSRERDQNRYRRPMFITGQVMLEDGTAPPQQVVVDLVCQGTVMRQAHTTRSGSFSFQLNFERGALNEVMPLDASVSSTGVSGFDGSFAGEIGGGSGSARHRTTRRDSVNMSACELRAELSGYQSDRVPLGVRRTLDSPDVGTVMLYPTLSAEGGTISVNTLKAPKKARKAFEKAAREVRKEPKKRDLRKAVRDLEKAVREYPGFSEAWQMLGEARLGQADPTGARQAFEKAIQTEPGYALPYVSLAGLELDAGEAGRAAQLSRRAAELSPEHPTAHYLNAMASSAIGQLEEAESAALRVQAGRFSGRYPGTHYVLGWVHSQRGEFETAAEEYRQYLAAEPDTSLAGHLREQITEWQSLGLVAPPVAPPDG